MLTPPLVARAHALRDLEIERRQRPGAAQDSPVRVPERREGVDQGVEGERRVRLVKHGAEVRNQSAIGQLVEQGLKDTPLRLELVIHRHSRDAGLGGDCLDGEPRRPLFVRQQFTSLH